MAEIKINTHNGHCHHHDHLISSLASRHDKTALRRIRKALFLNVFFTITEFIGGIMTGSMAIVADAIHDFGDSMSLGLAYFLHAQSQKEPSKSFSYGYQRLSLVSAVITGVVVMSGSLIVVIEAVPRFWRPVLPHGQGMLLFAAFGVVVNGIAAWTLSGGRSQNEKMLTWHLFEDVLGWVGVLIGSLLILWQGWAWVDPLLAILIALYVSFNVARRLKETVSIFLQASPPDIDREKLRLSLLEVKNVTGIHDLHIWSLDGQSHVLSLHVIAKTGSDIFVLKEGIRELLGKQGQFHSTIEVEFEGEECNSSCDA